MKTNHRFIKLFGGLIAIILHSCGAQPRMDESMALQRWQSTLMQEFYSGSEASMPQEKRVESAPLDSEINSFPFLVSAAPYYCDPMRYPPQVVLSVKSCQPYLKNIMQVGFLPHIPPGLFARGRLATNHP